MDTVKITYSKDNHGECCYFTEEQLTSYGLRSSSDNITLTFGSLTVNVKKIINKNSQSSTLCLSETLKELIYIPENTELQVKKIAADHLELGPLVGVFINSKKANYLKKKISVAAYKQFDDACKSLYGLICLFSIEHIDWNRKLVKGFIRKNSQWIVQTLPLPLVIYDRNVDTNSRAQSMELRKKLSCEYHIINTMAKLKKLETINALIKNPKLKALIPETIPYRSEKDVVEKLSRIPSLYLKPDSLSKGNGVFRISKKTNNDYILEYRTKEDNLIMNLHTLTDLNKYLRKFSLKGGGYIIQEEIQKASFRGNPFDFRLLYQKDWQATWQPSGIAVRIAAPGSVITSPRSGGTVEKFSTIIKEVFNEDISTKDGLYENVIKIGKEICLTIEDKFGDCVELGLDMTIDTKGKIWIIEVNGKPLKVSLKRLNNTALVARCNKRPIEYAVFLTGFQAADTELGGLKGSSVLQNNIGGDIL